MRESYAYTILQQKTKRLQKETGNMNLRSALDTGRDPKVLFTFSIVRPIKMLFLSPIVFLISLYMAIVYGYAYLMFTTFPRVFEAQYGFASGTIGLVYLGNGVGSFFGLVVCGAVSDRLVQRLTLRNGGTPKPEYRLPIMFLAAFIVPAGLFLYAWTAERKEHWILPIIGSGLLGFGMFTIFVSSSWHGRRHSTDNMTDARYSISSGHLYSLCCLGFCCFNCVSLASWSITSSRGE